MNGHIFKYELPLKDEFELELPEGHELCDIQAVDDKIFMWALIDIHAPLIKRFFKIVGTGEIIRDITKLYFLKTVVMKNGFVWHIFEA